VQRTLIVFAAFEQDAQPRGRGAGIEHGLKHDTLRSGAGEIFGDEITDASMVDRLVAPRRDPLAHRTRSHDGISTWPPRSVQAPPAQVRSGFVAVPALLRS
jgi:hypothetical protein